MTEGKIPLTFTCDKIILAVKDEHFAIMKGAAT